MIPLRPILDRAPDALPDAPEDGSSLPTWEDDRDSTWPIIGRIGTTRDLK